MGQLLINVKVKHGTRMKMVRSCRITNRQNIKRSLVQLPSYLASRVIILGVAILSILISIYINRASLQFFWLEVTPSLWGFFCGIFTAPTNLFILLNFLILSILALAHLHSSKSTTSTTPRLAAFNHSHHPTSAPDHLMNYADIECDNPGTDQYVDGSVLEYQAIRMRLNYIDDLVIRATPADLLHADVGSIEMDADPCQQSHQIYLQDDTGAVNSTHADLFNKYGSYNQDDEVISTAVKLIEASHILNQDNKFMIAARLVKKEAMNADQSDQSILSQSALDNMKICSIRDAEEHAKKAIPIDGKSDKGASSAEADVISVDDQISFAGAATTRVLDEKFIDSLFAAEGSIFTHAQYSRPLAAARFTRKKATTANDRPHSPLRISKPILKRGDTLEATWKAICESNRHSSPFNRHHHKHHINEAIYDEVPIRSLLSPIKQRSKGITGNALHDHELPRSHLLCKREPSMPQEELNAKVESFISRFNAQIKIQREKSLLEFMEMVGRGAS